MFDAGHCRACARQAGLLDHYDRVQGEEARRRRTVAYARGQYEIRVGGVLGRHCSGWFDGLQVSSDEPGQTLIAGPVVDQAALHGLLAKVRDLGLPLLSVQRSSPGPEPEEEA